MILTNTNKAQFKNKIKDLEQEEFDHPENFFAKAQAEIAAAGPVSENSVQRTSASDEVWINTSNDDYEGQLAVDVYQDAKNLYVKAIIGGIRPEDIEIHLNNDLLTVKGKRIKPDADVAPEQYYIQECFWGGFSRSIILPVDVLSDRVEATIEHGVLSLTLPKSKRPKNTRIPIKVK
ncbi:MAG: Hsp20/alpha crystallin family protein [Patescibacteria group bacterium]|jgi:HSP20 family protein